MIIINPESDNKIPPCYDCMSEWKCDWSYVEADGTCKKFRQDPKYRKEEIKEEDR